MKKTGLLLLLAFLCTQCGSDVELPGYTYEGTHQLVEYEAEYDGLDFLQYVVLPDNFFNASFEMDQNVYSINAQYEDYFPFMNPQTISGVMLTGLYETRDDNGRDIPNYLKFDDPVFNTEIVFELIDANTIKYERYTIISTSDVNRVYGKFGQVYANKVLQQANSATSVSEGNSLGSIYNWYKTYIDVNENLRTFCDDSNFESGCDVPDLVYFFASQFIEEFDASFSNTNTDFLQGWNDAMTTPSMEGTEVAELIFTTYGEDYKGFTYHAWTFTIE